MKTQLEFLKEAVALAEQNPTSKIHFASGDEHCEDKSWTQQHITKVEKTWYYADDEEILLDIDDVIERFEYQDMEITEEEAKEKMEEVILVYTTA